MTKTGFAIVALALNLLTFSGCSGGTHAPIVCSGAAGTACIAPEFLYATAQNQVLGFTVNPTTGTLSAPTTSPTSAAGERQVVRIANEGFLYVVSGSQNNQIDGYAVNSSTGNLTPLAGSPFANSSGPFGRMTADPQGKFLYSVAGASVFVFSINSSTGALTAIPSSPITTTSESSEIAIDPSGKFLYTTGAVYVSGFTVDSNTGALTPVPGSPFALPGTVGPEQEPIGLAITVDPSGHFVYVVVQDLPIVGGNNYVVGYSIDSATGALTLGPGSPSLPDGFSFFQVATWSNFLYVTGPAGINVFSVAPTTGALTEIAGSPFPAGSGIAGIAVSPDGKFLYEARGDGIGVFAINPTSGALTAVGTPTPTTSPALFVSIYRP